MLLVINYILFMLNINKVSAGLLGIVTLIPAAGVFAQTTDTMMKKDSMIKGDTMMADKGVMMKDKTMEKKMTTKQKMQMKKDAMKKKIMQKKEIKKGMMKSDSKMMDKGAMMKDGEMMKKMGSYMTVAPTDVMTKLSMTDKNILFFHAPWCPTCASADKSLTAQSIKMGYTIFKVDYDSSTDLKKKYGVTTQHTFVQVDAKGEMITSWRGGSTEEIYKNVK